MLSRSNALLRWAKGRRFDLAFGHGSNDVTVAARFMRVPCSTMFDYEWATVQHTVNCRLAQTVVVPEAIPAERLARYGARGKIAAYPGLKEEYYLADFEPDPAVLDELGLDPALPIVVVRTPPAVSLYHRFENDVLGAVLARLRGTQTVVLPRTAEQRAELSDGFIVPERAIDAQSLIAYADVVVSAGGTMNREAVALGTPVFTTFQGRLGAVDEQLIADGRLRMLERADDVVLAKRDPDAVAAARIRRDPALLAGLLMRPVRADASDRRGRRRMATVPFTLTNLKADLPDLGSNFDGAPRSRDFGWRPRRSSSSTPASGYQRIPPGYRFPYGHTHRTQEEVYLVLSGAGG